MACVKDCVMKWKNISLILILISVLFISGCISMDVKQKINRDGTSEIEIIYDLSAILGMAEQLGNSSGQQGNISVGEGSKENFTQACEGFNKEMKLKNAKCVTTEDYKIIINFDTSLENNPAFKVSRSIPYITYEYDVKNVYNILSDLPSVNQGGTGESQQEKFSDEELIQAKSMKAMGVKYSYTLEMPGKISKTDVGNVQENKVVIDMFDMIGKEHIYVQSKELNLLYDLAIVAIILILVGGAAILLLSKRRRALREQYPQKVQQPIQKEPHSFNQQLLDYINSCRKQGYSDDKIRRILVEKDKYPAEKIDQLMSKK